MEGRGGVALQQTSDVQVQTYGIGFELGTRDGTRESTRNTKHTYRKSTDRVDGKPVLLSVTHDCGLWKCVYLGRFGYRIGGERKLGVVERRGKERMSELR